ncbi:MAG TPA: hypothetical protein PLJ99_00685 [Kiritimatiellia bacterium]|nr:hypothetical protein [Kiritimatiellia bacterium]HRX07178.1 hypothetical protein [Kiritimatiellia bacterium]
MRRLVSSLLIPFLIPGLPAAPAAAEPMSAQLANEAAYLGDADELREALGPERSYEAFGRAGLDPQGLFRHALMGRQQDVAALLMEYGFPPSRWEAEKILGDRHMTPDVLRLFLEKVPGFAEEYGPVALLVAARTDNAEMCRLLMEAGVPATPKTMAALFLHRDLELIGTMIGHGADPYAREDGITPVELAMQWRSADLLRVLDVRGLHAERLAELEREHRPADGKDFLGSWRYHPPGGGFGEMVFTFYPDGTGLFAGGVGGAMGVWKADGDAATIVPMDEKGRLAEEQSMVVRRTAEGLELPSGPRGTSGPIRIARKITEADLGSDWRYPPFVRVEKVVLTGEGDLLVQINRRHVSVPLRQLVRAAQETPYGRTPVDGNLLRWDDFIPGAIPAVPPGSIELPFVDRHTSPGYSVKWDKLGFDHSTMAVLKEGHSFTVFPSETSERYYGPGFERFGESVRGYAILADRPFEHGKDWVLFYFLRSKENR